MTMPSLQLRHIREVPGRHYQTPKEIWGFRLPAVGGHPRAIARRVLAANAERLGLDGLLGSMRLRRIIRSLGAWHVIFSQRHHRLFIHRAYVTVHMDSQRAVYLIKNRAVPRRLLPDADIADVGVRGARQRALHNIRRRSDVVKTISHDRVWYPVRTRLHLAYKFHFHRAAPAEDWIVYVDANTGQVLSAYDNLAEASGRASVFVPNPVVALGRSTSLLNEDGQPVARVPAEAYRRVRLLDLAGSGVLDGSRVSTSLTKDRVQRRDLDFRCLSHQHGFEEVMAYHHLDRAIRYIESIGYRGDRALFTKPLEVNARATRDDNSWYSSATRSLGFGVGDVDDAEDGETILHEFGHALQDAICPDFGQSLEAAAMGEGFGDYFAASYFASEKASGRRTLLDAVMTWDGILCPDSSDPTRVPCVRRVDQPITFESFDHSPTADEHENGEIWSAALWDVWKALDRARADRLIIESHFQLDGFTTFAKGARAILDADRNLYRGRHLTALRRIFRRRGIGPVD
jgi:hypothetical protein